MTTRECAKTTGHKAKLLNWKIIIGYWKTCDIAVVYGERDMVQRIDVEDDRLVLNAHARPMQVFLARDNEKVPVCDSWCWLTDTRGEVVPMQLYKTVRFL